VGVVMREVEWVRLIRRPSLINLHDNVPTCQISNRRHGESARCWEEHSSAVFENRYIVSTIWAFNLMAPTVPR